MSSIWATKVMAEYDSKYKVDARIIHDQLLARLPVGTDPLAMKDDYGNEVNPGLLEIIASNLEHLAKLLRRATSKTTKPQPRAASSTTEQPPGAGPPFPLFELRECPVLVAFFATGRGC